MNLNRLVITLLLSLSAVAIHADQTADLRKMLPSLKGDKLIDAYGDLYSSSLEGDDVDYQIKCVNDWIAERLSFVYNLRHDLHLLNLHDMCDEVRNLVSLCQHEDNLESLFFG